MPPTTSSLRLALSSSSLSPYRRLPLRPPLSFSPIFSPLARNGPTYYKYASSSTKKAASKAGSKKSNKIVLEKPTRYNPPSHSSRRTPGHRPLPLPALTPEQEEERRTKTYPGMRFHKGSLMHWFLTSRWVHVWITLSTLIFFSVHVFLTTFLQTSPYVDQLPPRDTFYTHPMQFIKEYHRIWKITTEYESAIVKEKRDKLLEDVEKRRRYTKIHGLDHEYWFFGWGLEGLRDGERGEGVKMNPEDEARAEAMIREDEEKGLRPVRREDRPENQGVYVDWDGKRRPLKKWFGIW